MKLVNRSPEVYLRSFGPIWSELFPLLPAIISDMHLLVDHFLPPLTSTVLLISHISTQSPFEKKPLKTYNVWASLSCNHIALVKATQVN